MHWAEYLTIGNCTVSVIAQVVEVHRDKTKPQATYSDNLLIVTYRSLPLYKGSNPTKQLKFQFQSPKSKSTNLLLVSKRSFKRPINWHINVDLLEVFWPSCLLLEVPGEGDRQSLE
uniref:hypothetical protein n=1 Tax=Trichocoleus desertorum TaxID=1481672 RepID=UPI0025B39E4E|nr:hypothetical protein [Trichocoleus desertorum]